MGISNNHLIYYAWLLGEITEMPLCLKTQNMKYERSSAQSYSLEQILPSAWTVSEDIIFFFWTLFIFIYLIFGCSGFHCFARAFSSCGEQGLLFVVGAPCNGFSCCRAWALGGWALAVAAHGLNCSMACGIFLDQGSNLCPLYWQVSSYPLYHLGSPGCDLFKGGPSVTTLWLWRDS